MLVYMLFGSNIHFEEKGGTCRHRYLVHIEWGSITFPLYLFIVFGQRSCFFTTIKKYRQRFDSYRQIGKEYDNLWSSFLGDDGIRWRQGMPILIMLSFYSFSLWFLVIWYNPIYMLISGLMHYIQLFLHSICLLLS